MSFSRSAASSSGHRQRSAGAEQVDLEDQQVVVGLVIQHVIERRVGGDAAVPIMLALDYDGGKARRQRAGRHDVLGADLLAEPLELDIVEIAEIARGHADRADAEPGLQVVDAVEIDQPLQRLAQRRGVVIALRLRAALRPQRRRRNARGEEAGHAEGGDQGGAGLVEQRALAVAADDRIPRHRRRNHLPEFLQPLDALSRLVAGDDRGVDGADRDAGNPVRLEIAMAQRLIGAGLVGAERAAALQDEHALRLRGRRCGWRIGRISIMTFRRSEYRNNAPWRQFAMASIGEAVEAELMPGLSRGSVDARMSVQNTLYLVFGA